MAKNEMAKCEQEEIAETIFGLIGINPFMKTIMLGVTHLTRS